MGVDTDTQLCHKAGGGLARGGYSCGLERQQMGQAFRPPHFRPFILARPELRHPHLHVLPQAASVPISVLSTGLLLAWRTEYNTRL